MQTIQQFPSWFSRQKLVGKLAIGCGGLFLFFCLCMFSVALFSPSTTNAEAASTKVDVSSIQTTAFETAIVGAYQTATANAPTVTPFPTITSTPNLPTSTSTPDIPTTTSSPVPTDTPQATKTPIDIYPIVMNEKVQAYTGAYFDVVENNQEAADNKSLLFDNDWKIKQGLALGILDLRANEMAEVQPSPKFAAFHSIIVKLVSETHLFTKAYASGIDRLDADLLNQALQHMQNMNSLVEKATAELNKIAADQ